MIYDRCTIARHVNQFFNVQIKHHGFSRHSDFRANNGPGVSTKPRNRICVHFLMIKSSSSSTVHPIPLLLIVLPISIVSRRPPLLRGLSPLLTLLPLNLPEIRPIQWTRTPQPQPGPHTLEIKQMCRMAWKPNHQRIRIIEERIVTDGAGLRLCQERTGDAFESCCMISRKKKKSKNLLESPNQSLGEVKDGEKKKKLL